MRPSVCNRLSVYLSFHQYISVYPSICLCICPSVYNPSVHVSVCLSVCPSSQVTFIYIARLTLQIVSKQLHNIKIGKYRITNVKL